MNKRNSVMVAGYGWGQKTGASRDVFVQAGVSFFGEYDSYFQKEVKVRFPAQLVSPADHEAAKGAKPYTIPPHSRWVPEKWVSGEVEWLTRFPECPPPRS